MRGRWQTCKCWAALILLPVRRRMQYRGDAALDVLGQLLDLAVSLCFFGAVAYSAGNIAGEPPAYILLLLGCVEAVDSLYAATLASGIRSLSSAVLTGRLDSLLLKPIGLWSALFLPRIQFGELLRLAPAGVLFYIGWKSLELTCTAGQLIWIPAWIFLAVLARATFGLAVALTSFWIGKVEAVAILGDEMFQWARFPYAAFPPAIRWVFTYLIPVLLLGNVPAQILLGRWSTGFGLATWLGSLCFLTAGCYTLGTRGLRAYRSAGG